MGNRYSDEEWKELKDILLVRYPLHELWENGTAISYLDFSDAHLKDRVVDEHAFVNLIIQRCIGHKNKELERVGETLLNFLFCSIKNVALGINEDCVKNLISWRLQHNR